MSVSNGQRANQTTFNNAFLSRTVNTNTVGKIDLQNTDPASGPSVLNAQQAINQAFQNKNLVVYTATHSKVTWDAGELSFTENIIIKFPESAFLNTLSAAQSPIAVSDGESIYVTINRSASIGVTAAVSSSIPGGKDTFRIATRVGSALIMWDGALFRDGVTAQISDAGGVVSLGVFGDADTIEGDAKLEAGNNITLTRDGSSIKIDALGGGGGGGGVTYSEADGSVEIKLRPTISTLVLQSPDLSKWDVTVNNAGDVTATSGSVGTPVSLKVTKPDTSEAAITITNAGELQVISPPPGGETLNDSLFLASPDGTAWHVAATDLDEFQVETDTTLANAFTVRNDTDAVLFKVQEIEGEKALHYIPLLDAATLPAAPLAVAGCLPWAIYDSGANKRPIYFDSLVWRYVHDNSLV